MHDGLGDPSLAFVTTILFWSLPSSTIFVLVVVLNSSSPVVGAGGVGGGCCCCGVSALFLHPNRPPDFHYRHRHRYKSHYRCRCHLVSSYGDNHMPLLGIQACGRPGDRGLCLGARAPLSSARHPFEQSELTSRCGLPAAPQPSLRYRGHNPQ